MPATILVTTPVEPTMATPVAALLHPPPAERSLSDVVAPPAHTTARPVMAPAFGNGFTETTVVAAATPQPFVTV